MRESLFDPQGMLIKHLEKGFASLEDDDVVGTEEDEKDSPPAVSAKKSADSDEDEESFTVLTVNVIDPSSAQSVAIAKKEPERFPVLARVLETEYRNTLRNVPYTNYRSGEPLTLQKLPIRLVKSLPGAVLVNTDTTASSMACHVYLASCPGGMEQYRNQVKPSIMAFLSQISSNSQSGTGDSSEASSSSYLIVYCPQFHMTGTNSGNSTPASPEKSQQTAQNQQQQSRVASFASRMMKSNRSKDSAEENKDDNAPPKPSPPSSASGPLPSLNKVDRDVLRRLTADFVHVCALTLEEEEEKEETTEKDDKKDSSTGAAVTESDARGLRHALEWPAFLAALGQAVVRGFVTQCQYYDEALKQAQAASDSGDGAAASSMDWVLVKESWALLYQQMQQPSEAVLQYEELRAMLPEISIQKNYDLLEIALSGHTRKFREELKKVGDLSKVVYEIEHYLLLREVSQLFALREPVRVVERCMAFGNEMYEARKNRATQMDKLTGLRDSSAQAHVWALEFCRDVLVASPHSNEKLARSLCYVAGFARRRLLQWVRMRKPTYLGRHFGDATSLPEEMVSAWDKWVEPPSCTESSEGNDEDLSSRSETLYPRALTSRTLSRDVLGSQDCFELIYMELTKRLSAHYETCKLMRNAACLRMEVIDIEIRNKRIRDAIADLSSTANIFLEDGWDACCCFLLFRLAWLQRSVENPRIYLKTLVRCFSYAHAPKNALKMLFQDITAVIASPKVAEVRVPSAPMFRPILSLEKISMAKVLKNDRSLFKKAYSVGNIVTVDVFVESLLPEPIELNSVCVWLVPFKTYVSFMEEASEVQDSDAVQFLTLPKTTLQPGENHLLHKWIPRKPGQYILSSVTLTWGKTMFTYTAKQLKRPTIRIDVTPCKPSHAISAFPAYILPGHEQTVNLVLASNQDFVKEGVVKLQGSTNLKVADPAAKEPDWGQTIELPLASCRAGESLTVPVLVKSIVAMDLGTKANLVVGTKTKYTREGPDDIDTEEIKEDDNEAWLECDLHTNISALKKRAFTVVSVFTPTYKFDRMIVSLKLRCNAQKEFCLKKWSLQLPDGLTQINDLNETMTDAIVANGEEFTLVFDVSVPATFESDPRGTLTIEFANEVGATFSDNYPLRIKSLDNRPAKLTTEKVAVSVKPSAGRGVVGQPIQVSCVLDTSKVGPYSSVFYAVSFKAQDWMLNGKTQGLLNVQSGSCTMEFMMIPMRSGVHSEFLTMTLSASNENNGPDLEIPLDWAKVNPFMASDPVEHRAVAYLKSDS